MNLLDLVKSKYGMKTAIFLAKTIHPKFANSLFNFISKFVANRTKTNLVQTLMTNQWVIRDEILSRNELKHCVKDVVRHQMQCSYDLFRSLDSTEKILSLSPANPHSDRLLALNKDPTFGAFLVALHMSNFDMVMLANAYRGMRGIVLTYGDPTGGYEVQNDLRRKTELEIVPIQGEATHKRAIAAMKEGHFVITGVDRPIRKKQETIKFFDRPSPLPVGHIRMAIAADVPVIAACAIQEDDGTYTMRISDPIYMERMPNREEELRFNAEKVLAEFEKFIRLAPEQWLMYYPVWGDIIDEIQ